MTKEEARARNFDIYRLEGIASTLTSISVAEHTTSYGKDCLLVARDKVNDCLTQMRGVERANKTNASSRRRRHK